MGDMEEEEEELALEERDVVLAVLKMFECHQYIDG